MNLLRNCAVFLSATLFLSLTVGSVVLHASETSDPFMGDWQGLWQSGEDKHPNIAAQVIPLGNRQYQITLLEALYQRVPPDAVITATGDDTVLRFDDGFFFGEIQGDQFSGGRRGDKPGTFLLQRFNLMPPSLGAQPPEGAIVLFDGSGFDAWGRFPKGSGWDILEGGILQANPNLGTIETRRKFGDCRLHLEFRVPLLPEARGQERGNSGVFLQHYYEVQILDSYGLPGYWNECGAIYRVSAPYVNMCLPPLQWQTYDIEFRAARFDEAGNLFENARITVLQNGVAVQKDQEIPRGTSGDAKKPPVAPVKDPGSIRLQSHKNQVQFRNIWVVDLTAKSQDNTAS
ncbi:MAG: hypothetical protein BWY09_00565 [Candidatus Hydrogenedentes bacterium ADurb.Bin179]|nr:MAG: hypothetical protein BWY09_00565 [Candidatus Hydrogenedentes bacterium ADurb.Bin179]